MYKFENTHREKRFQFHSQAETENPSFSSVVLDKILHSIDEEEGKSSDMKFYTETTVNKMSKINAKRNRFHEEEPNLFVNIGTQIERKKHHDRNRDQDVMFFSSTSSSSDSSSGLLSYSSDTESMYRAKSRNSCFAHSKPKPVKTTVPPERSMERDEEIFIKSKSRAMKLYNNLKKVKQPISPGGKLTSFLNSLFINTKKSKSASSYEDVNAERKSKNSSTSGQTSTCSSASSFSRSCLRKNSSTSRDKPRNGAKRTVRFCPVSVIVDEDNRVCGNKCLHGGGEDSGLTALSVPTAWKIGRTASKKKDQEVLNMNKRVDDGFREFHLNQKLLRDFSMRKNKKDNDDVASSSSSDSDLFELDHLALIGNDRYYSEDLPVFETTHVRSNRAIRIM